MNHVSNAEWDSESAEETPRWEQEGLISVAHPGGHFLLSKGQKRQGTTSEDPDCQVRVRMKKPHLCLVVNTLLRRVVTLLLRAPVRAGPCSPHHSHSRSPAGLPSTAQRLCESALLLTALETQSPRPRSRSHSPSSRLLTKAVALPLLSSVGSKHREGVLAIHILDGERCRAHTAHANKANQLLEMQGGCWRTSQLPPPNAQTTLLSYARTS